MFETRNVTAEILSTLIAILREFTAGYSRKRA
jgi:hypothetical protein